LGYFLRQIHLIEEKSVGDIKKLVVNVTLPLLLFKAFATMQFEIRYLLVVGMVFAACLGVMLVVGLLKVIPGLNSKYAPYLMTGFEAGMLGYALFSSIYGDASIPKFAVIDLGQVLFVFLILIPRLEYDQTKKTSLTRTALFIITTPVIIAIIIGILFNYFGLFQILYNMPLISSVLHAAELLAGMTPILVALAIGYELSFQSKNMFKAFQTAVIRLGTWVILALVLNAVVVHGILGLDRTFEAAVMIMAILPAPFVIPLYLREGDLGDRNYIINMLSIGIIAALAGSIVVKLLF